VNDAIGTGTDLRRDGHATEPDRSSDILELDAVSRTFGGFALVVARP
jgi:hypothetical protein